MGKVGFVIVTILLIVTFGLGGIAGYYKSKSESPVEVKDSGVSDSEVFSSQSASIKGKVIKNEDGELTVVNTNSNKEGKFRIADSLVILDPLQIKADSSASGSAVIERLEFNKDALISLEFKNGEYLIRLIQYINPAPSIPPLPVGLQ